MGKIRPHKIFTLSALLGVSVCTTPLSWGLDTTNNTAGVTKNITSQGYSTYKQPAPLPGIAAQAPKGRPTGNRYWFTPDKVRIVKVRGSSQEGGTTGVKTGENQVETSRVIFPLPTWAHRYWKGDATAPWLKTSPKLPEAAGWEKVPYPLSPKDDGYELGAAVDWGEVSLAGQRTDRPYDAGLTRYELWLGKKPSETGGWKKYAWFFHAYNVVNQGGQILGSLNVTTADANNPNRTFRDTPYLVDCVERSSVVRTYSQSKDTNNNTVFISQPKMLVLTCPDYEDPEQNNPASQAGSASISRVLNGQGPRKYQIPPAPGTPLQKYGDINNKLAPNININDAGPQTEGTQKYWETPLAANWHYDQTDKTWVFRRWQRSEVLDSRPYKNHVWVLETKEDLLYAPQDKVGLVDPGKYRILDANANVANIQNMVVASHEVRAFDTGGFRLGLNDAGGPWPVYSGIEDIPDAAAINVLPVGLFYPECTVIVALEYALLDKDGKIDGDWKASKLHIWSAATADPMDKTVDQSMSPRQILFTPPSGTQYDPYVHGWIFPIKDVSHTSATYRVKVYMALPVKSVAVPNGTNLMPTSIKNDIGSPYNEREFTPQQMALVLEANSNSPMTSAGIVGSSAVTLALGADHHPGYRQALETVDLYSGAKYSGVPNVFSVSDTSVIEKLLEDATVSGAATGLSAANLAEVLLPFGKNTQWFEYRFPNNSSWTVSVPTIEVGVDAGASGVIITE